METLEKQKDLEDYQNEFDDLCHMSMWLSMGTS